MWCLQQLGACRFYVCLKDWFVSKTEIPAPSPTCMWPWHPNCHCSLCFARATLWLCQQLPSLQAYCCSGSAKRFLWAPVNKRVVQERALWCTEQDRRLERATVHISHLRYPNQCLPVAVVWAPVLAVEIPVDRPLPLLGALWHGVLFACIVIICGWWSFPGRFLLRWNLQETTQTAPRSLRNQEPWWRNSYIFTVFVLLLVLTPGTVTSIYNVKGVERVKVGNLWWWLTFAFGRTML